MMDFLNYSKNVGADEVRSLGLGSAEDKRDLLGSEERTTQCGMTAIRNRPLAATRACRQRVSEDSQPPPRNFPSYIFEGEDSASCFLLSVAVE